MTFAPDSVACIAVGALAIGMGLGSWMRGRRDEREARWLQEFRDRYRNMPPIGDPDGGRRAD